MKSSKTNSEITQHNRRALLLLGTIATVLAAVACTNKPKPSTNSEKLVGAMVRPAAMETSTTAVLKPASAEVTEKASPAEKPAAKPITFKSRDYGVSFVYPWQYTFLNAKSVAKGDESLRPKPDGSDSQFTLARIEIPKGFYADTDLKNAYFTLSLNQDIAEQDCVASVSPDKNGEVRNESINGVNFRWMEMENGGRGRASKIRNYVSFANDTCYEVEMGVNTESDGISREVDPDQVMRRLNAILKTVRDPIVERQNGRAATEELCGTETAGSTELTRVIPGRSQPPVAPSFSQPTEDIVSPQLSATIELLRMSSMRALITLNMWGIFA